MERGGLQVYVTLYTVRDFIVAKRMGTMIQINSKMITTYIQHDIATTTWTPHTALLAHL